LKTAPPSERWRWCGPAGGDFLLWVDAAGPHVEDCRDVPLPYGPRLLADIRDRTETAMKQAHCFLACELGLRAEAQAVRVGALRP
jgi:hypothetical protein